MTPQELNVEFAKAGPTLIHSIDGSQKKALITYLSIIAKQHDAESIVEAMQIVWDMFQKSSDNNKGLALFLNTEMTKQFN